MKIKTKYNCLNFTKGEILKERVELKQNKTGAPSGSAS